MEFSQNIADLSPSATMAVSALARRLRAEGKDVINLSAGEPDFDTPGWISDAAVRGLREGGTRYTPPAGLPELREAAAESLARLAPGGERSFRSDEIVVSCGAKHSLFNACFSLFGPGDEVLVAAPYWTSYPEIVKLARAAPVFVKGPEARDFRLAPDDLEARLTPRTKGLILCSPGNPTGAVYSADELRAVAEWAKARSVWLVSDEIYRSIYFGRGGPNRAPSILDLPAGSLGPAVLVDGLSKAFAMTGWRIGFTWSSAAVASRMAALQSHTTSNPATPSQFAALEALRSPERAERDIGEMRKAFLRRRDLAVSLMEQHLPGLSYVRPEGAFYLFFRIDGTLGAEVTTSEAWCQRVLEESGVAVVPGSAFGDDRYVRLSFATSDEMLSEAMRRMGAVVSAVRS